MLSGRRLVTAFAASAGLVAVSAVVAPRAVHATPGPSGSICTLNGTATLKPGLTNGSQQFNYTFSGALSNCQASDSTAPAAGTVTAGTTFAGPGGSTYQYPIPYGTGGCSSSTTTGVSVVTWADGTITVVGYTTNGAAAAVALQGSVAVSVLATKVGTAGTGPATVTVSTNRYSGDTELALLAFQPPDPTACGGAGVTTAAISGEVGTGTIATS